MERTTETMPSASSPSSHQSACRNAARVRTVRSLPSTAERIPSTMCAPVSSSLGYTPTTSATVPPEIPGTSSAIPISAPRSTLPTASSGPGLPGTGLAGSRSESATGS